MIDSGLHPGALGEDFLKTDNRESRHDEQDLRAAQNPDPRSPRRFLESSGNRRGQEGRGARCAVCGASAAPAQSLEWTTIAPRRISWKHSAA